MSILIVIPARGGSKGIPRKNLRPLYGKPLLFYSIKTAQKINPSADVVVTTDDEEISLLATKLGVAVIHRVAELADDATTLDPVIFDAYEKMTLIRKKSYSLVITLQPTSPLLRPETLQTAIAKVLENKNIDTLISGEDDTHLTWKEADGKFVPNYFKRINRQQLPKIYKETGGFLITRGAFVSKKSRIGNNVSIYPLQKPESIDIDSFDDFHLCEYFLRRNNILIVTNGNLKIGLGHVYNTLSIANEFVDQQISFFIVKGGDLAEDKIRQYNYPVIRQVGPDLAKEILSLRPQIVINDLLDTSSTYIRKIKRGGCKVVNFEDLGSGAKQADLVFNAIYPEDEKYPHHFFGYPYFILRDEFYLAPSKEITKKVERILVTFGGVDINNFTLKVLESVYDYCIANAIKIDVVAGLGYSKYSTLAQFPLINIHKNVQNISALMGQADIIFTSAGRTTFEIASMGIPSIVLAQNKRETTHLFASNKNGFKYLGLGTSVSKQRLYKVFTQAVNDFEWRKESHEKMVSFGIKDGKKRTVKLIRELIHEIK